MSTKISEDYIFDDSIYSFLGMKFVPRHPPLSWQENFCSSPPPHAAKIFLARKLSLCGSDIDFNG